LPEDLATLEAPELDRGRALRPETVDLSIVMPVFNEEQALPMVLEEAVRALSGAPFTFEIVLVDDASTDRGLNIMMDFQECHPEARTRILRHQSNQGIMAALNTLFAAAAGSHVFINGSDGQCSTSACVQMMALRDQFDIVVGQRKQKQYTVWRALVSWSFNFASLMLFGVRTFDAGSIKLYPKEVLQIPLLSRSPFQEAERLIRARRKGYRIGMIPVEHRLRTGGKATGARIGLVMQAILDLARCWWDIVVRRN
jgi:glycosyltransferase involved in cell wall biosynthesis